MVAIKGENSNTLSQNMKNNITNLEETNTILMEIKTALTTKGSPAPSLTTLVNKLGQHIETKKARFADVTLLQIIYSKMTLLDKTSTKKMIERYEKDLSKRFDYSPSAIFGFVGRMFSAVIAMMSSKVEQADQAVHQAVVQVSEVVTGKTLLERTIETEHKKMDEVGNAEDTNGYQSILTQLEFANAVKNTNWYEACERVDRIKTNMALPKSIFSKSSDSSAEKNQEFIKKANQAGIALVGK